MLVAAALAAALCAAPGARAAAPVAVAPVAAPLAAAAPVAAARAPAAVSPGSRRALPLGHSAGTRWFAADRALLARLLASSGVDRRPQPPPSSYLLEIFAAFTRAFTAWLARWGDRLRVSPAAATIFAWTVLALALALLTLALARAFRLRRRAIPAAEEPAVFAAASSLDPARDAASWRLVRDRALAEGRLAEALSATWWWLARSLAGSRAEPTWTGRDLLAATGRDDLRPLLARLDAFVYGPWHPAEEPLRRLIGHFEEALG